MYNIGELDIPCSILAGDGKEIFDLRCSYSPDPPQFLSEINTVISRKFKIYERRGFFNGRTVKLVDFQRSHNSIVAVLGPLDFFSYLATNVEMHEKVLESSDGLTSIYDRFLVEFDPLLFREYRHILSNLTGPNAIVITSDEKVILCKRSNRVAVGAGVVSSTISAAVDAVSDADTLGVPDITHTLIREAHEELGLTIDAHDIQYLGIAASHEKFNPEFIAMVRVKEDWNTVKEKHHTADDAWEGSLFAVDFNPHSLKQYLVPELLGRKGFQIFSVAAANLVLALINVFGEQEVVRVFRRVG